MEFAINTGYFRRVYGSYRKRTDLECAQLCKKGVFSLIDYSPNFLTEDDRHDKAKKLAEDFLKLQYKAAQLAWR